MKNKKLKIVIILGPTASGKSDLAVRLARKFNGEIISADSRQIYRGLNIGSGKITRKEMKGVPHHLLDVASPKRQFSVAQYKKLAEKAIAKIYKKRNIPIIVGGAGFYIQSIADNLVMPAVKPDYKLRKRLEKKSSRELFTILKKLDKSRASNIERDNPRRLIRAIEIARHLGKVPEFKKKPKYDALQIGLKLSDDKLHDRINKRLLARVIKGMVAEARFLHNPPNGRGLSWKRMESLGLEYRYLALYLQKKIGKKEMLDKIKIESSRYAKRQMRWFKRDKRIIWFNPKDVKNIEQEIKQFINP